MEDSPTKKLPNGVVPVEGGCWYRKTDSQIEEDRQAAMLPDPFDQEGIERWRQRLETKFGIKLPSLPPK